jgi:hypothetical protein
LDRGIGEEIKNSNAGNRFGKVLGRFEIGTTPMNFICSRMRTIFLSFAVLTLVFLAIILLFGLKSPLMMLVLLVITSIMMAITILVVVGLLFAMMYPMADRVLRDNWTKVTSKGILIQHKLWITTGTMRNFIPFKNISRIEPIDNGYMEDRKKRTKLWYRVMVLHPEPPPGGLYHYYSDPKGLVVLHLKEPMVVHNLGYFGKFSLWPMPHDKMVKEVILDIDPDRHEDLFGRVREKIFHGRFHEIESMQEE